jgi:hypothetical protein
MKNPAGLGVRAGFVEIWFSDELRAVTLSALWGWILGMAVAGLE